MCTLCVVIQDVQKCSVVDAGQPHQLSLWTASWLSICLLFLQYWNGCSISYSYMCIMYFFSLLDREMLEDKGAQLTLRAILHMTWRILLCHYMNTSMTLQPMISFTMEPHSRYFSLWSCKQHGTLLLFSFLLFEVVGRIIY